MKLTIEIPEDLQRRVKARSAMEGIALRGVVEKLLRQWLGESPEAVTGRTRQVSVYDLSKKACGIVDSGITDLASNPKHLKGFGRGSMGHR